MCADPESNAIRPMRAVRTMPISVRLAEIGRMTRPLRSGVAFLLKINSPEINNKKVILNLFFSYLSLKKVQLRVSFGKVPIVTWSDKET